jgi:transcriptional regulator GlxA family with amidase domain
VHTRTIGFYVYDGSVLIEFAGPLQVFDVANRVTAKTRPGTDAPFKTVLISRRGARVTTREGVEIAAAASIDSHPPLDLMLIPGGALQAELDDKELQLWLKNTASTAEVSGSVCVGSFMLGKAGLLDGRSATTHFGDVEDLAAIAPAAKVTADHLWVDEGKVVTAGGYTAGIDMALHLVSRFLGVSTADETARQLEYAWRRAEDRHQ